ncbi:hypothetical protein ACOME3_001877 [Neoechinorhynchus agilis]
MKITPPDHAFGKHCDYGSSTSAMTELMDNISEISKRFEQLGCSDFTSSPIATKSTIPIKMPSCRFPQWRLKRKIPKRDAYAPNPYKCVLAMSGFEPSDIEIKATGNDRLKVKAKHNKFGSRESAKDFLKISHRRTIHLPRERQNLTINVDLKQVHAYLTNQKYLVLEAAPPYPIEYQFGHKNNYLLPNTEQCYKQAKFSFDMVEFPLENIDVRLESTPYRNCKLLTLSAVKRSSETDSGGMKKFLRYYKALFVDSSYSNVEWRKEGSILEIFLTS